MVLSGTVIKCDLKKESWLLCGKAEANSLGGYFIVYARDHGTWPREGPGGIEIKRPDSFWVIPKAETETKIQVQVSPGSASERTREVRQERRKSQSHCNRQWDL